MADHWSDGWQLFVRLCAVYRPTRPPADFVITLADDNHLTLRPADSPADGLAFSLTRQSPRVRPR